jgi:RimJ/RimL family protein N-acetyltransferase
LIDPDDAPKVLDYFRAAGRRYDPPLPDSLLTLDHWRKQSEHLLKEHANGSEVRLFVFTPDESEIVGTVGLSRITRGVRFNCSLSNAIREKHVGGFVTKSVSNGKLGPERGKRLAIRAWPSRLAKRTPPI